MGQGMAWAEKNSLNRAGKLQAAHELLCEEMPI